MVVAKKVVKAPNTVIIENVDVFVIGSEKLNSAFI